MIKSILFDAGGTIIHQYPSRGYNYKSILEKHGYQITEDDLNYVWDKVHKDWYDELKHIIEHPPDNEKAADFWARFNANMLGLLHDDFRDALSDSELHDLWIRKKIIPKADLKKAYNLGLEIFNYVWSEPSIWRVYPDVPQALHALREGGYRLAVISNWDKRLRHILDKKGISDCFDNILTSADIGIEKPDKRFFHKCLERLDTKPQDSVYVGDEVVSDGIGGFRAGFSKVILIDRDNRYPLVFKTHPELKGHIQRIRCLDKIQDIL